jgi:hypothetical protein
MRDIRATLKTPVWPNSLSCMLTCCLKYFFDERDHHTLQIAGKSGFFACVFLFAHFVYLCLPVAQSSSPASNHQRVRPWVPNAVPTPMIKVGIEVKTRQDHC